MTNKIETVSGVFFDISDPCADDIEIVDIAWGLSRQARFAGHTITSIPYSVAQHSLYVTDLVKSVLLKQDKSLCNSAINFCGRTFEDALQQDSLENILMAALLHDASEAYLMDVPSPVKNMPGFKEAYGTVEKRLMDAIMGKFCYKIPSADITKLIKWADVFSRAVEAYHFMPSRGAGWVGLPTPPIEYLHKFAEPMTSFDAYKKFIDRFEECGDVNLLSKPTKLV